MYRPLRAADGPVSLTVGCFDMQRVRVVRRNIGQVPAGQSTFFRYVRRLPTLRAALAIVQTTTYGEGAFISVLSSC